MNLSWQTTTSSRCRASRWLALHAGALCTSGRWRAEVELTNLMITVLNHLYASGVPERTSPCPCTAAQRRARVRLRSFSDSFLASQGVVESRDVINEYLRHSFAYSEAGHALPLRRSPGRSA